MMQPRSLSLFLALLAVLLAVVVAYLPGLHGPFVLDDGENITLNGSVALKQLDFDSLRHAVQSNESGPLGRPLASLSFAVNHYLAGGLNDPFPFKVTNLVIHLINSVFLFYFVQLLSQTPAVKERLSANQRLTLAILVTALWALHPIQVTNVLYVVQRMNSLSTMFVLSGLIVFMKGRLILASQTLHGITLMLVGVISGTLLGLGAKENAALLPLLALAIDSTLFANEKRDLASDKLLRRFYFMTVAIPAMACITYLAVHPDLITQSYAHRTFTPLERLLTETRVLWFYISLIFFPVTTRLGLFHDDISVSANLIEPASTLIAFAFLAGIVYFVSTKVRRYPVFAFAMVWFLAGHLLESSIFGLELVFEHRNYLPSIGVLYATGLGLITLPDHNNPGIKKIVGPLIMAIVVTLGFTTWSRANTWNDLGALARAEASHHPYSPNATDFAARACLANGDLASAIQHTTNGIALSPSEAGFHIDLQILLALLSTQIEPELAHLPPESWRAGAVSIQGMPECVKAVKDKAKIRLVCEMSSSMKIVELLKQRSLSVHVGISLEELRRCLTNQQRACQSLEHDAVRWFSTAVENPRTAQGIKERILFSAALVHAHRQDYQNAVDYLKRASELAPTRLSYQLGRVEYLLRMNRRAEAAALLHQATALHLPGDRETSLNEEAIRTLRKALGE